jgi:hypothetical protein
MFTRLSSTARGKTLTGAQQAAEAADVLDSIDWASVLAGAERACCCSARPIVVAVFPPQDGRSRPVDLLLCGHHYRACRTELANAGAVIHRMPGH